MAVQCEPAAAVGKAAYGKAQDTVSSNETARPPVALTIAGSDSGGGAGIQADLKTFEAFGVFGTAAVTAVTAQNTVGVFGIHTIPPKLVIEQIRVVASDLRPAACKSGMLADDSTILAVAEALSEVAIDRYVLDPVMVAASGAPLLDPNAVDSLKSVLLPLATVVTPNLDEAAILADMPVRGEADMREAARRLIDAGCRAVLVKGGHLEGHEVVDILFDGSEWREWRAQKLPVGNAHGTGCTLSAAIAAGLAWNQALETAIDRALSYTRLAISTAPGLGAGSTPLNHRVRPR
jgi:hydroxymethylpyrimidine/phosphomethylpyrimidine kinase